MSQTKILYLISSLAQGGAERHLVDLVRSLEPVRWDPAICVRSSRIHFKAELPPGQPRYSLRSPLWGSPAALARMVATLRSFRPRIVHAYMNDANLWARLMAQFAPEPKPLVVTSVHLDDISAPYRWLERRLADRSDRIVAHSRSVEQYLVGRLGVAASLVTVIPNGVDEQDFRPCTDEERRAARTARGFTDDHLIALMPARIAPQKNQDLVIAALADLQRAGQLPPHFRLLLAGRVSSASYHRQVKSAIARSGLERYVQFLGSVTDMRSLYGAADVVLMPSRTEASPIAALEALSCGVPVLISAAANTDAVLVAGRHGWQIDVPTVETIAESLRRILAGARAERLEMGGAGRQHVVQKFTRRRMIADFESLYAALEAPERACLR